MPPALTPEQLERRRAGARRRYAANAEKIRQEQREYRAANREKVNAQVRARRAANPEHNREVQRAWRAANADKVKERNRIRGARRDRAKDSARELRARHGMVTDEWGKLWDAQNGECYLCGGALTTSNGPGPRQRTAVVDHIHSCCGPKRSCQACRRGLACSNCNLIVGRVLDDPMVLRRIADNLEVANAAALARMALVPVQDDLFLGQKAG